MAVYRIGDILRMKREALGITREQLCELSGEFCSIQTLYRIESGKVKIKKNVYRKLMECMGELSERNYASVLVTDGRALNLKAKIYDHIVHREYKEAKEKLEQLEKEMIPDYVRNKQYLKEKKAYLAWVEGKITDEKYEQIIWENLKFTIPNLDKINIAEWPYNADELEMFFNLIKLYKNTNEINRAEELILKVKKSCEKRYMEEDYYISWHTFCIVELSMMMSINRNFKQAIKYCDEGMEEYKEQKIIGRVDSLLYDKAWNMELMIQDGIIEEKERELCKKLLVQAYYMCISQRLQKDADRVKNLCEKFYPGEIMLL